MMSTMAKPTNVLFIITDQQRWDTLGCYGNELIRTPHLDCLAAQGMAFDRAYCESPICMPSRVTLLTGKRASHHGVTLHCAGMRTGERTLAHAFSEHGYRTHAVGKLHLQSQVHPGNPESIPDWRAGRYAGWRGPYAGFDTAEMILGHSNALCGQYGDWLRSRHADRCHLLWEENWRQLPVGCGFGAYDNDIPEDLHATAWCADRALEAMSQAADAGKPFFLHIGFPDPHWPINPPPRWFHMYDGVDIPASTAFPEDRELSGYPRLFRAMRDGSLPPDGPCDGGCHPISNAADVASLTRAYWGAISFIDHHVGRLLDGLRRLRLEDDTLVIFTTDHGEFMGDHGLMTKGNFLYDSFVRVPFLSRLPGRIPAGARHNGLLSFLDVPATIAALCGIDPGLRHDGCDQSSAWQGGPALRRRLDISHFSHDVDRGWPDLHTLVTEDGWKLTYYAGEDVGELYHLPSDPAERRNRWTDPADREQRDTLIRTLLDSLIQGSDRQSAHDSQTGAQPDYHRHVMSREVWAPEMAAIAATQRR